MMGAFDKSISTEMEKIGYEIMQHLDDTHWWYRARNEIIADVIAGHLPNGGRIIDLGSGSGATAAFLRARGYCLTAADISSSALDGCRRRGLETIDLRCRELPEHAAECIILGDVLEHVPDEVELLAGVRKALVSGGIAVITVPAYEFLWSGEDYISRHYRRYRRPQLAGVLSKGGFDLMWASYYNTILLPPIAAVLLMKRIFFPRSMYESDLVPIPSTLNRILYGIFRAEAPILRHVSLPFGASIIAVATLKA